MAPNPSDPTKDGGSVRAADETTPLLTAPEAPPEAIGQDSGDGPPSYDSAAQAASHDAAPKPFPYVQVLALCYAALAEPTAYFAIFPFINEMIHIKGGVEQTSLGYWAGFIEALFSLVQMTLMIFYGRLADRIGRKPILVFSLTGIAFATAAFGMSQSLWQMVFFRALAGTFAGSVVTVRTMLSENTTKETQGKAFAWYMFTRNMGILIGPLIGGGLANPAEQFPSGFGGVPFWEKYPYALATYTVGVIVLSAAITSFLFLNETLKRHEAGSKPEPPMSTWEILKTPGVAMALYIYGHCNFLATVYTTVTPTFFYTDIELGGLGFSDQQIAGMLALVGAAQSIWVLGVFPPLQKKLGTGTVMRWCAGFWPFFMAAWPVLNEILRAGHTSLFWVLAPSGAALGSGVAMGFACVQLFVNDISPTPTVLGTVNALALALTSGLRAIGPLLGNSVFAAGVKSGWADGHAVWILIVFLAVTLNIPLFYLPAQCEGKLEEESSG